MYVVVLQVESEQGIRQVQCNSPEFSFKIRSNLIDTKRFARVHIRFGRIGMIQNASRESESNSVETRLLFSSAKVSKFDSGEFNPNSGETFCTKQFDRVIRETRSRCFNSPVSELNSTELIRNSAETTRIRPRLC